MFTEQERSATLERTLALAREDPRIEAAVLTGSLGAGRADRWSDIDLDLIVADTESGEAVAADWVARAYAELSIVHHYETAFGSTLVRGLFLGNGLLLDLAFTPGAEFSAWAAVMVAFDRVGRVTKAAANPTSWSEKPDTSAEAAFAWHDILHARTAIERGRPWQAVYFVQRVRNRTLALAAVRRGLDADDFKEVDGLPDEATSDAEASLVGDLRPDTLRRALASAAGAFLHELRQAEPALASRIHAPVLEIAGRPG
jgi:hypothetical protein